MNGVTAKAEQLESRPRIAEFLQTHKGAEKELCRAIEFLAEKPDAERAVIKLFPALSQKKIFVFFSYKKKDERAAKAIVSVLRKYSAGKLNISYQADFTEQIAGKRWREKIREEVCRANWFILLLPDPSDDWDWCLYETGLFDREPTPADRLICLHHPDTRIPDQIQDYHAVSATIPEVEKFLRMVYLKPNPVPGLGPINAEIESEIPAMARQVVEAIRPARESPLHRLLVPQVTLEIEDASGLNDKDDLDNAVIISANDEALNLFDFLETPKTWGLLRSEISESEGDGRWREELVRVIKRIGQGKQFDPIQAIFRTKDDKVFRPVASAIDRMGAAGTIRSYEIMFVEEVGVVDDTAMPEGLSTLATVLRLTFRFRWEILKKFGDRELSDDDIERLENALRGIEADAESRGMIDQDSVLSLFSADQLESVTTMLGYWGQLRNPVDDSGELDRAIKEKDGTAIAKMLKKISPMNQDFLEIAAERFAMLATGESRI